MRKLNKMDKKESLDFLDQCLDEIKSLSQEEFDKRIIENGLDVEFTDLNTSKSEFQILLNDFVPLEMVSASITLPETSFNFFNDPSIPLEMRSASIMLPGSEFNLLYDLSNPFDIASEYISLTEKDYMTIQSTSAVYYDSEHSKHYTTKSSTNNINTDNALPLAA